MHRISSSAVAPWLAPHVIFSLRAAKPLDQQQAFQCSLPFDASPWGVHACQCARQHWQRISSLFRPQRHPPCTDPKVCLARWVAT